MGPVSYSKQKMSLLLTFSSHDDGRYIMYLASLEKILLHVNSFCISKKYKLHLIIEI
jgi:hypothetical protein